MVGHGRIVVGGLTLVLLGCTAPDVGPTQATAGDDLVVAVARAPAAGPVAPVDGPDLAAVEDEVGETLSGVAAAFLAGDPEQLRPWLHDPTSGFGRRWLARADAIAGVPLSSYELSLDTSLPDLTTPDLPGDGGLLVNVLEDHQLEGMDELGPLREHLFLTLRRRDGRWTVAGDDDAERLGLVSADHLWDHGPVVTSRRGGVLLLHHPGQRGIDDVLAATERAIATTDERWPLSWPRRVPVLVPSDQDELAALLHVTFDLSNFVAFATTTPVGELGDVRLAGSRVVLNTERFLDRSAEARERILVHELVHAASRPSSSTTVPSWLEEGVAQALGEQRSATGTGLLDDLVRTDWSGSLPLDPEFSLGGRDDIFLSYQQAWSFADWVVRTHGADALGAFYRAVGAGSVGRPGTAAAQLDAAALETLGAPLDELVTAWRASL